MRELIAGNVKQAMRDAGAGSRDLWHVPIDQIRVIDGFNVRTEEEFADAVAEYTASILANGFLQNKPLAGYAALEDGKQVIYLTDGECRLRASREAIKHGAEISTLPVVMSPKGTNMVDLTVGLHVNNSGRQISQYALATLCKRLVGFGVDEKEIGRRLGMPTARINGLLSLTAAPAAVRKLVTAGTVSATEAIRVIKKEGPAAAEKLQAGAAAAKLNGKAKATRKDIEPARPSHQAVCKALVKWDDSGADQSKLAKIVDAARAALG